LIGAAIGKDFISSNSKVFHMEAGLLYTKEDITDSSNTDYSTEAFIGADITMNWEMVKNLYWQLSYSQEYDNQPSGQSEPNDDYNLFSGLAYKFN
jgi:hypothetical protein